MSMSGFGDMTDRHYSVDHPFNRDRKYLYAVKKAEEGVFVKYGGTMSVDDIAELLGGIVSWLVWRVYTDNEEVEFDAVEEIKTYILENSGIWADFFLDLELAGKGENLEDAEVFR